MQKCVTSVTLYDSATENFLYPAYLSHYEASQIQCKHLSYKKNVEVAPALSI